ncbi:MAG: hypothetical protein O2779_00035 [Nanoarchaeota archaeon]|nr:hypothetical protein [Nanoarchaeota archaeon]
MEKDNHSRRAFFRLVGERAAGIAGGAYLLTPLGRIAYNLATGEDSVSASEHHHSHGLEKKIDYIGSANFALKMQLLLTLIGDTLRPITFLY